VNDGESPSNFGLKVVPNPKNHGFKGVFGCKTSKLLLPLG